MVLGNSMIESPLTPSVNAPLGESRGECEREFVINSVREITFSRGGIKDDLLGVSQ
jgi:hypothetical protein